MKRMNDPTQEDLLRALSWDPAELASDCAQDIAAELGVVVDALGGGTEFDPDQLHRMLGSIERRARSIAKLLDPQRAAADRGDGATVTSITAHG